jgi:phenylalanyl-tRNA synthetase alpha chain
MPAETDDLAALLETARAEIESADSPAALAQVRARYLGRKGALTARLRALGGLAPEQRLRHGQRANDAKQELERLADARRAELEARARAQALAGRRLDSTLPGAAPAAGRLHPITRVMRDMVGFFGSLGFSLEVGPEVDTEYNNFEALNIDADHPARDEQDTLYVEGGWLLRTHTSTVQIRAMTGRTPPFRFIAPGRVYRHDLSPRHSPMFHQIEGFLVDDRVNFGDLKGVLESFGRFLLGERVRLRFRANHFPFTEPSGEMDYTCLLCDGQGCVTCSRSGWIEWGGCGMIHPRVLERCGIDPARWQGIAFGMSLDRTAMLRWGLPQMRHLFEGDLRVLEQL